MKKNITLIITMLIVMILAICLTGCSNIKDNTVSNTQSVWNDTANKEATDTITITNFNLADIFKVSKAKLNVNRKFENGNTTIDVSLDEFVVSADKQVISALDVVLPQFVPNPTFKIAEIMEILKNVKVLKGNFVLTNNNTKLDYKINIENDYQKPNYDKEITGSVDNINMSTDAEYGEAIKQGINLLMSHLSSVFEPTKKGAIFNPTKIIGILDAAKAYYNANDVRPNSEISQVINNLDYNKFFTKKIQINETSSKCSVKKNFITKMDLAYTNIEFTYTSNQLTNLIVDLAKKIAPDKATEIENFKSMISNFFKGVTPNGYPIGIEKINVNSVYSLK